MPYKITQGGMLDGTMRHGGDVVADADVAGLQNFRMLVDTGYLVATDEEPPEPAPKPEPKAEPKPVEKQAAPAKEPEPAPKPEADAKTAPKPEPSKPQRGR